jgi:hypothetical protein
MLSYTSGPALGNFEAGLVARLLCAPALPAVRTYDCGQYRAAPDLDGGSVKRKSQ